MRCPFCGRFTAGKATDGCPQHGAMVRALEIIDDGLRNHRLDLSKVRVVPWDELLAGVAKV